MPEGVITGGWSYVIAVYSITVAVLVAQTWSLWRRERTEDQRSQEHE